jgi:hypothetical protein
MSASLRDRNKKKPKRYKQYRLRMSDAEDARLKRLSEETGMSCADVMRDALDKYRGISGHGYFEDDLR